MSAWTEAAERELEDQLAQVRRTLDPTEVDPDEVLEDLRGHVREELRAAGFMEVRPEHVRAVCARMGVDARTDALPAGAGSPPEEEPRAPGSQPSAVERPAILCRYPLAISALFGVLLPMAAIAFELATRILRHFELDPFPMPWHVGLVALVPLAHLVGIALGAGPRSRRPRLLLLLFGATLPIAAYYTVVFAPALPVSAVLVFIGLGLLGFAPVMSLVAGLLVVRAARSWALEMGASARGPLALGLSLGTLLLTAAYAPGALTSYALERALSDDPATAERGVRLVRRFGLEGQLRQACLEAERLHRGPFDDAPRWDAARLRRVYFRVTDRALPDAETMRAGPLELAGSRLDAKLDADAAVAYIEWTLELRNDDPFPREARAVIQLPHAAVVSRAALWIDGEPREAAYSERGRVTRAYEEVTRARKDPLLVTTAGPDRAALRAFPIPAHGALKLRVGITAPLRLIAADRAELDLPRIIDASFEVRGAHALWCEAKGALALPWLGHASTRGEDGLSRLHGEVSAEALASGRVTLVADRSPAARLASAPDPADPRRRILQTIDEAPPRERPVRHIVLVVDGSTSLRDAAQPIARALESLPPSVGLEVVIASDDEPVHATRAEARRALERHPFAGGIDPAPVLARAWDRAAQRDDAALVWVHGAHPVRLSSVEPLQQRLERGAPGRRVPVITLAAADGPSRILEALDVYPEVEAAPAHGDVAKDLEAALADLLGPRPSWRIRRERVEAGAEVLHEVTEASSHVARLAALDEVRALLRVRRERHPDAVRLASRYRLVTPVTGAVVLETAEQYERFGLTPADARDAPHVIPEPSSLALLLLGLIVLARGHGRARVALRIGGRDRM